MGMYWLTMYAPKFDRNPMMIYCWVVPLTAIGCVALCLIQWHFYKHPDPDPEEERE